MLRLKHFQTGEIREGKFEDLQDLDNRIWLEHPEANDENYITVKGKWGAYQVKVK